MSLVAHNVDVEWQMCNAVLCVLGRQWVGKLLSRPIGSSHLERTMRHEERKRLAYGWIKPLVVVLYWSLLLSIGLFITGLLYQLRNLATSFDQSAITLQVTWGLGIALASGIIGTISATTIHAIRFESSPFEGLMSKLVGKVLELVGERWQWIKRWRVNVKRWSNEELFKTFMELISEANDPKLLDRAVPSFSYQAWVLWGEGAIDLLNRTYSRLMAADTTNRVRETVKAEISRFAKECLKDPWGVQRQLRSNVLNTFLSELYSFPSDFPAAAAIASFQDNNKDLRDIGKLPLEECVAKLLCTYDQDGELGNRTQIFEHAVLHCNSLLIEGNEDEVTRIFSDPFSVLRSVLRMPDSGMFMPIKFILFLVHERRSAMLLCVNSFLQNPPDYVNPKNVSDIIWALSRFRFPFPINTDLSAIINFISQRPRWDWWTEISESVIDYLSDVDISTLSDSTAVFKFLQRCLDPEFCDEDGDPYPTTVETCRQAIAILARESRLDLIVPLPPSPSPPALHALGADSSVQSHRTSDAAADKTEAYIPSHDEHSESDSTSSIHLEIG